MRSGGRGRCNAMHAVQRYAVQASSRHAVAVVGGANGGRVAVYAVQCYAMHAVQRYARCAVQASSGRAVAVVGGADGGGGAVAVLPPCSADAVAACNAACSSGSAG